MWLTWVLYESDGTPIKFFSVELATDQRRSLGEGSSKTIIFEVELCAVVLATDLRGRPVVAYVDNNSARDTLISGVARIRIATSLIKLCFFLETVSIFAGTLGFPILRMWLVSLRDP